MECLVCGVDALKVESDLDGKELSCPDCGHFAFRGVCFQFSTTVDSMLRKRGGGLSASGVLIPTESRSSQVLLFSGLSDQAARRC